MRHALFVALALPLLAAPAAAQEGGRLASNRPTSGAARPRSTCGAEYVERVTVADSRGVRTPVLDEVARDVSFWFRPATSARVRTASFTVTVGARTGVAITPREGSADTAYQRVARQAVDAAAHEHAFDRLAPDSASGRVQDTVLVHFGADAAGRQLGFTERSVCTAVASDENPRPVFPLELLADIRRNQSYDQGPSGSERTYTRGDVEARFVVDSAGRIDPNTFEVLSATHPAFAREVKRVLPLMRYHPAELAGRPTAQVVEQHFVFTAK